MPATKTEPLTDDMTRQRVAAVLCEVFAHGRVAGQHPTWGLKETTQQRPPTWLDAFAGDHKDLHAKGKAEFDWPAWERAADYLLGIINHGTD